MTSAAKEIGGPEHRRHHRRCPPAARIRRATRRLADLDIDPAELVVIVGGAEPEFRFVAPASDGGLGRLSAASVLELAWTTGIWSVGERSQARLVRHRRRRQYRDEIVRRYRRRPGALRHPRVRRRRRALQADPTPICSSASSRTATWLRGVLGGTRRGRSKVRPRTTVVRPVADSGDWEVILGRHRDRVPRKAKAHSVGGQIPTGFDPTVWGISRTW